MTLGKIAAAKRAMITIGGEKLPYGMAAALAALDRAMEPLVGLYAKEEQEICERYGTKQGDHWQIPPEKREEYLSAMKELSDAEAPLQWVCPRVKAPREISVITLRSLEDFIEWEE